MRVMIMRVDKFLKNSRLIKRREVAKEACEGGRVSLNGKVAKPSTEVKVGDVIEISFGGKSVKAEIMKLSEHVTKASALEMYTILSGGEIDG
jgi:ribosomal 50S subunit-recycling heat shock protein